MFAGHRHNISKLAWQSGVQIKDWVFLVRWFKGVWYVWVTAYEFSIVAHKTKKVFDFFDVSGGL